MPSKGSRIGEIILIPGLLEPALVFAPLAWRLRRRCGEVLIWPDRMIFRNLDRSVERLGDRIDESCGGGRVALVTHSFGDWIARQAIAGTPNHRVACVISLTPVLRPGLLPWLLYLTTGRLIPEIAVIFDRDQCRQNLSLRQIESMQPATLRRLVIWSRIDESVRRVPLTDHPGIDVETYWATHMTISWRPRVVRRIEQAIFGNR